MQRREWQLGHPDALHDLLIAIGDLSVEELRARIADPEAGERWLAELERARRVISVSIGGERRIAAAEDAGRLRDALGVVIPYGLPQAFLEGVTDAPADLVARYARTHGPFTAAVAAARFGLSEARVHGVLERLESTGRVVRERSLPAGKASSGATRRCCGGLSKKSLIKLRKEVEPVSQETFARLLVEWQGAGQPRSGHDVLAGVLDQLEGFPLVASALEQHVLPARVDRYHPAELDVLTNSGDLVWRGLESVGPSDGRIAFYRSDRYGLLAPPATAVEGELASKIREHLKSRGASFFTELVARTGIFPRDLLETLWDMVWAGELTNDTILPLRGRLSEKKQKDRPQRARLVRPRLHAVPGSEGRWWLLERLLPVTPPTGAEIAAARVEVLLERYGVLPREAIASDGLGTFAELYPVLKALEDAGRIRRGYFVSGLGAAQFARPGADDRLRLLRASNDGSGVVVLAATDPANPYGASLPWPEGEPRPQRAAGASVVLADGSLLGYLGRREENRCARFSRRSSRSAVRRRGAWRPGWQRW